MSTLLCQSNKVSCLDCLNLTKKRSEDNTVITICSITKEIKYNFYPCNKHSLKIIESMKR